MNEDVCPIENGDFFFSAMYDLWVSDLLAKVKIVTFKAVGVLRFKKIRVKSSFFLGDLKPRYLRNIF